MSLLNMFKHYAAFLNIQNIVIITILMFSIANCIHHPCNYKSASIAVFPFYGLYWSTLYMPCGFLFDARKDL